MKISPRPKPPTADELARLRAAKDSAPRLVDPLPTAGGYRLYRLDADGRGAILGWTGRRWVDDETFEHPLFWAGAPRGPAFVLRDLVGVQDFLWTHILPNLADPILRAREIRVPVTFSAGSPDDLKRTLALIAATDPVARRMVPNGDGLRMSIWLYAPSRLDNRLVGARWAAGGDNILSPFGMLLAARLAADHPFDGYSAQLGRGAVDRLSQARIRPLSVEVDPPLGDRSGHECMAMFSAAAAWMASLPDWAGSVDEAGAALAGALSPDRLTALAKGLAARAVPMMGAQEVRLTEALLGR